MRIVVIMILMFTAMLICIPWLAIPYSCAYIMYYIHLNNTAVQNRHQGFLFLGVGVGGGGVVLVGGNGDLG